MGLFVCGVLSQRDLPLPGREAAEGRLPWGLGWVLKWAKLSEPGSSGLINKKLRGYSQTCNKAILLCASLSMGDE